MKIGRITISDRASCGVYEDLGGPAIETAVNELFQGSFEWIARIIPDEHQQIAATIRELTDEHDCWLVLTTGGTGPAVRDVTPEATRDVLERELPGFGEAMRISTFAKVPTSILSRAIAGTRGRSLIINFPGNPKAIGECLPVVAPAIAEAIFHLRDQRPLLHTTL